MRLTAAMWLAQIALICAFAGCAQKPLPSSPDGRACFVAMLDSETAMLLRAQSHAMNVKSGDWVITPECVKQHGTDLVNETYRMTR